MAGLSALAEIFHRTFVALKCLGVAYLPRPAWKTWHQPAERASAQLPRRSFPRSMLGAGMALTLGNPKITAFYLALLPSLIELSQATRTPWAVVAAVTVVTFAASDVA